LFSPEVLAAHLGVERWTYDEFPMPGRLFEEVLELLYREDRLMKGVLFALDPRCWGLGGLVGDLVLYCGAPEAKPRNETWLCRPPGNQTPAFFKDLCLLTRVARRASHFANLLL
jgi:hypothetical protein